jgi:hypothetical protein
MHHLLYTEINQQFENTALIEILNLISWVQTILRAFFLKLQICRQK